MTHGRHNAALQRAGESCRMAIGEFGGAPAVPGDSGVLVSTPLYWFYEMSHAALNPSRAWADATRALGRGSLFVSLNKIPVFFLALPTGNQLVKNTHVHHSFARPELTQLGTLKS